MSWPTEDQAKDMGAIAAIVIIISMAFILLALAVWIWMQVICWH